MNSTRVLVGLGNPGEEYAGTRHNVGEKFVNFYYNSLFSPTLEQRWWEQQKGILLAKHTENVLVKSEKYFMNESGKILSDLEYLGLPLDNLYVVHDDLDLKLGEYKIQFGKGPELHGGVNDIERVLGTKDFWRIRIGVDNRDVEHRVAGPEYVLQDFLTEEQNRLQSVFHEIAQAVN